jgi:hypothetical protein
MKNMRITKASLGTIVDTLRAISPNFATNFMTLANKLKETDKAKYERLVERAPIQQKAAENMPSDMREAYLKQQEQKFATEEGRKEITESLGSEKFIPTYRIAMDKPKKEKKDVYAGYKTSKEDPYKKYRFDEGGLVRGAGAAIKGTSFKGVK